MNTGAAVGLALIFCLPLVLATGGNAGADEVPLNLRLEHLPILTPDTLTMRVRFAAVDIPLPVPSPPLGEDSPDYDEILRRKLAKSDVLGVRRSLDEKVTFRFNLGFGIDGGQPSNERLISGAALTDSEYEELRVYGFGDAVIGTRGLGVPSLSTYLAAEFRFDEQGVATSAIPTRFDTLDGADNLLIRSGYADVEGFFANKYLKPFRLRAGRQFRYGPAIAHFDGLSVAYDIPAVYVAAFSGTRVSLFDIDYDANSIANKGLISGGNIKVDIGRLGWIPIVVTASSVRFDSVSHSLTNLAYRPSRNSLVGFGIRFLGGKIARQTFSLRTRLSEVTTVKVEVDNTTSSDWTYDALVRGSTSGPEDDRHYLSLGAPLPRLLLRVRAGTVVFRNFDLLLSSAVAIEHRDDEQQPSPFYASYFEVRGAAEARVRRNIRLGVSAASRRYLRPQRRIIDNTPSMPDIIDFNIADIGERTFFELGGDVRYTAGARVFSASAELYSRIYDPKSRYIKDEDERNDVRTGGRFAVEGWAGDRLRMKGVYDLSINSLLLARELTGLKSLRVLLEGSF